MSTHPFRTRLSRSLPLAAAAALSFAAGLGAAPLDLSRVPLIVNTSVPPNLMVTLDDSGSMGFGFTPDEIETVDVGFSASGGGTATYCFWRLARYYSPSYNSQYFDPSFDYPPPLLADGTQAPNSSFTSAWINGFNTGEGTVNLSTSYFVSFWEYNLNTAERRISNANLTTTTSTPMGTHSTCAGQNQNNVRALDNKSAKFPFGSVAFYYQYNGGSTLTHTNFTPVNVSTQSAAVRQAFANWFSYYRLRGHTAKTALSRSFARVDQTNRVAWQNLNANQLQSTTTIGPITGTRRTNFFNWLRDSPYSGSTPLRASTIRAGQFFERSGSAETNPYWDAASARELSCRQNFHILVTDGYWNENNPTSPSIGNYDISNRTLPDGTAYSASAPVSRPFWNELAPSGGCNGNNTNCSPTIADIAFYYWARDLRGLEDNVPSFMRDLTTGVTAGAVGNVSDPFAVPEIYFNPANDPASWQHMVNFIVGFGVVGTLNYDEDPATTLMSQAERLRRIRVGTDRWPNIRNLEPTTIDDAWHAAINSRGQYLSAQNPQELVDAISNLLESINNRNGIGGAAAASSTVLNTDRTLRFVGTYDTRGWSGDLLAYRVRPDGQICPDGSLDCPSEAVWRAQPQLNTRNPNDRVIITSNAPSGGAGVAFRWASLSSQQQAWLNTNPATGTADTLGQQRLNFLRGDRSQEQFNGGALRNRTHVLGAIIESSTVYVSAPSGGYSYTSAFPEGGSYADFVSANRSRRSTVYVGANDGMLHAFDAGLPDDPTTAANEGTPGTGRELFAYVPYETFHNLNRLTTPDFNFVPTVDGTPVVKDVYIGGRWRTILLSNLRAGGQGVFALDITDPAVTESGAASRVLWEFSDNYTGTNAGRLGYTYGRPNFARLSDGRWVAVIPGGYNNESTIDLATRGLSNTVPDPVVGDGTASLFIVDLASGTLIREVRMPSSANGLAEPVIGDYEGDFVDDVAVMGDIVGNVWRVDLRTWATDRLFQPAVLNARPITARPRLFPDPITQGFMVIVGTGKFVELGDRTTALPQRQVIMGVRDLGAGSARYPAVIGNMIQQTFSGLDANGFFQMATPRAVQSTDAGWYIQLGNSALDTRLAGERVIDAALAYFQPGFALFESFIPTDDPCQTRSMGALYAFAASDGAWTIPGGGAAAALAAGGVSGGGIGGGQNAFDTNSDGRVNESDSASAVGRIDFSRSPNLSSSLASPGGGNVNVGGAQLPSPVWRRRGWREIE